MVAKLPEFFILSLLFPGSNDLIDRFCSSLDNSCLILNWIAYLHTLIGVFKTTATTTFYYWKWTTYITFGLLDYYYLYVCFGPHPDIQVDDNIRSNMLLIFIPVDSSHKLYGPVSGPNLFTRDKKYTTVCRT